MSKTDTAYQTVVKSIELSRPQTKVFNARSPLILDMAGQRAGKSQMIGVLTGLFAIWFPKLRQFVAANTYLQLTTSTLVKATEIWKNSYGLTQYHPKNNPNGDYVIDKVPPAHFYKFQEFKEYYNIISFRNGAIIYLGSLDNYLAHDGKEFGVAHLDETKQTRKEAVTTVITGRLSQEGLCYNKDTHQLIWVEKEAIDEKELKNYKKVTGADFPHIVAETAADMEDWQSWRPLYVHTSPAVGTVDWLNEMFELEPEEKEIKHRITQEDRDFYHSIRGDIECIIYSTHHNQKNLPADFIQKRSRVLSEGEYLKFVCGYPFSKSGGEYFPFFLRSKHVGEMQYFPDKATHLTFDYNVLPYMTGLANQINTLTRYMDANGVKHDDPAPDRMPITVLRLYTYRGYAMRPPHHDVISLCTLFKMEHPVKDVYLYGDAAGRSRVPGMGDYTNFKEINNQLWQYLHNESDRTPKTNMMIMVRRNIINRVLEGKIPEVEILIHPSCHELIRDLEYLKLGPEGKHKEEEKDENTGVKYTKLGHMADAWEYFVTYIVKHFIQSMD